MKIKHLYLLFVTTLLFACGEGSKHKQEPKKMSDVAVNTDKIKRLPEEQQLSQSSQDVLLDPTVTKTQRKIKIVTCNASSQTVQEPSSISPKIKLNTSFQEDDLESCSSVATEASPAIADKPSEKEGVQKYSDVGVETLPMQLFDNGAQTVNQQSFDKETQASYVLFPEEGIKLPINDNQAIFTHALNQVQEKFQNAYKARELSTYNDFIVAIEDYKAAHNHLEALRKEFAMLGQNTPTFDVQLATFREQYSSVIFDKWQSELDKNLAELSKKNERSGYPVLEKMALGCITNFEKTYEGEYFEYDALGHVSAVIERDNFPRGETSGIKSKIKAGDLDGAVRQLSPLLVERINIVLIEDGGKGEGGAYSLSEINAILAAPDDTKSRDRNVPGLGGRPYPYFQSGALIWSQGKKIIREDFEKLLVDLSEISKETIKEFLLKEPITQVFFRNIQPLLPLSAAQLLASVPDDFGTLLAQAPRTNSNGLIQFQECNMSGIAGQSIELKPPLFIHLKGEVTDTKITNILMGSVSYRLGNTVIGAIQGYSNSGNGFGQSGQQSESSIVLSQNFGLFFIEAQSGLVIANQLYNCEWNGYCSQVTIGCDTANIIPFMQLTYRQLDRNGAHTLNETTGWVGLDIEVGNFTAEAYNLNMRLLSKIGYGQQKWSIPSKDIGTTSATKGSIAWNARLNLRNGISFCASLSLDTQTKNSAEFKASFDG
jgi:hypothetical protein